jgi:hypothetical protein
MSAKAALCLVLLLCASVAAEPAQSVSMQPLPSLAALAQPVPTDPAAAHPGTSAAPLLLPGLSEKVIRDAVRATLAEPLENPWRREADTIRGNSYTEFAEQFSQAKVPDCLHGDALKRQPPRIGFVSFTYLYAVPFVVLAKIRGKCN